MYVEDKWSHVDLCWIGLLDFRGCSWDVGDRVNDAVVIKGSDAVLIWFEGMEMFQFWLSWKISTILGERSGTDDIVEREEVGSSDFLAKSAKWKEQTHWIRERIT